jgi:hypothetical protein
MLGAISITISKVGDCAPPPHNRGHLAIDDSG